MIDYSKGFLENFEQKYSIYEAFQGNIDVSYFPPVFKEALIKLFEDANYKYDKVCSDKNKDKGDFCKIFFDKDKSGNIYMRVIGADEHTNLIIRKNISNYADYKDIKAKKITEIEFLETMDRIQLDKYNKYKDLIPKRFQSDAQFDVIKELDLDRLNKYAIYLAHESELSEKVTKVNIKMHDQEPTKRIKDMEDKTKNQYLRINEIIDSTERFSQLRKYQHESIIETEDEQTGIKNKVFIYDKKDYYIAFAEPYTGESYSKIMFFPKDCDIESEVVKKMEYSKQEVTEDPTIIRSSHTTIERFKGNLEYLQYQEVENVLSTFKNSCDNAICIITENQAKRIKP